MSGNVPLTRQQRRAMERKAAKQEAKGKDPGPLSPNEASRQHYEVLRTILSRETNDKRATQAAELVHEAFDRRLSAQPKIFETDCKRGCSFCCHGTAVSVAPPEALLIAEAIRRMPEPRRSQTRDRVISADRETHGQPPQARRRSMRPCPLLVDNACSIYRFRPLSCRSHASIDARVCEAAYNGGTKRIPKPVVYDDTRGIYESALSAASRALGLTSGALELNAAVSVALRDRQAADKWLRGMDVFAEAKWPKPRDGLAEVEPRGAKEKP